MPVIKTRSRQKDAIAGGSMEAAMDLEPSRRLMCQCTISKGTVKLDLD